MNNELTSAKCRLCDCMLGKRQMTNHLKACWEQHTMTVPGKATPRWFHLVVEARYAPDYWMHLQAPADCTFGDLDSLLRAIWLECCGHLSAFEFPVKRKLTRRATPNDIAALFQQLVREAQPSFSDEDDASGDELLDKPLGSKLKPGVVFSHQYDFGSTTELALRVAGEHTAAALPGDSSSWPGTSRPPSCARPAPSRLRRSACNARGRVRVSSVMLAPGSTIAARKCLCP